MSFFNSILRDLQQKINSQQDYKGDIITVIKNITNVTLHVDEIISFKQTVLTLKTAPTIKMAIILKKQKIITALQEKNITVTNII